MHVCVKQVFAVFSLLKNKAIAFDLIEIRFLFVLKHTYATKRYGIEWWNKWTLNVNKNKNK